MFQPCNPKHPEFPRTGVLCIREGIEDALTEFRWVADDPIEVETFFTAPSSIVLDSIYFQPGSRVSCVARAMAADGSPGLETESAPVTIAGSSQLCGPREPGAVGAEPFSAQLRYTGLEDPNHPNRIEVKVKVPHWDGLLPAISTQPLSHLELVLAPGTLRLGLHRCSNLLDVDEVPTEHGFITGDIKNPDMIGEVLPYQFSKSLRGEKTLRFYRNLDLESCMWEFTNYYDMSELVTECGASLNTDRNGQNLAQSYVSVRLPLHVSYIYHAPHLPGNWRHHDLGTTLRLAFVYDSAQVWDRGLQAPSLPPHHGALRPSSMTIRPDGRLAITFRTSPSFRGRFLQKHPVTGQQSTVTSPSHPELNFDLRLLHSSLTGQEWQFVSDFAAKDYSGTYLIHLVPCLEPEGEITAPPDLCEPGEPVRFDLPVRFQQVTDPRPTKFSLTTLFLLLKERNLWLQNVSTAREDQAFFSPGEVVYGKILVDPGQSLGQSFRLTIEKCFVCTGAGNYVPRYRPDQREFGCASNSPNLLHSLKIISTMLIYVPYLDILRHLQDRGAPETAAISFQSLPFNATLLDLPAGADGFTFSPDPLFQVSHGRQWYIHCIYVIRGSQPRQRRHADHRQGTDLHPLVLSYIPLASQSQATGPTAQTGWTLGALVLVALALTALAALWRLRRPSSSVPHQPLVLTERRSSHTTVSRLRQSEGTATLYCNELKLKEERHGSLVVNPPSGFSDREH
ncbi:FREM2 [Cordylochernes scorpioides]|uniref:FREM2 n=1 Tax=Cordylochernes scorpioides TaxID=51811 RepID=A0ABY6K0J3_9ARAC|nr:FREM2 [Cordylochernes scorpioides]